MPRVVLVRTASLVHRWVQPSCPKATRREVVVMLPEGRDACPRMQARTDALVSPFGLDGFLWVPLAHPKAHR